MSDLRNVFIDIEAIQSGEDDSEEEGLDDQDFIQEDQLCDTRDEVHPVVLHRPVARAEDEEENDRWQDLLDRAHARTNSQIYRRAEHDFDEDSEDYELQENDVLWEVGCKAGSEKAVVFEILQRALYSTDPGEVAVSAMATSTPARIYVEARSFAQVTKLARSVAELNPVKVSPVPREDILNILDFSPSRIHWPWARVRGNQSKWRWYVGDTGLITKIEGRNKKYLALIPRISGLQEGQSRPPQALAVRSGLENREAARAELYGRFVWQGHLFSTEGLLLVDMDNIGTLPLLETLPSSAELALFRSTSLLSTVKADKTAQQIAQARMKTGDRVKVVSGPYLKMIGVIKEMKEKEVSVYLPSQDIVDDMPKDTVRADFAVGDEVKVLDGQSQGLVGWVIGISLDKLRVLNIEANTEVSVSKSDVEFHNPERIFSLRPRDEYSKWGKLGEGNPNDVYNSKRVMVIGNHELKGYKGLIKSTTTDGYAFLQLDCRPQQSVKVKLLDLSRLTDQDQRSHKLITRHPLEAKQMPSTSAQPAPSPLDLVGHHTPAWLPSESRMLSDLSPAWDPSSRTPLPRIVSPAWDPSSRTSPSQTPPHPNHWLDNSVLQRSRLKLKINDPSVQSPYVEFLGVENGLVKVRDKMDTKFVAFESVNPLLPTSKGDLVVPKNGEMQGVHFNVIRIAGNLCVVRKPGTRPTKKNPDTEFAISDLVQVHPARR